MKILKPGDRVFYRLSDEHALRDVPKERKQSMATVLGYVVKFAGTPALRQIRFRIRCDRKVLDSRIWTVKRDKLRLIKAAEWTDADYKR